MDLRDPAWLGITGIATIVSVLLFIAAERQRILSTVLLITPVLRGGLLVAALTVVVVFFFFLNLYTIDGTVYVFGIQAGLTIGGGLVGLEDALFWSASNYFLLRTVLRNLAKYTVLQAVFIVCGGLIGGFFVPSLASDLAVSLNPRDYRNTVVLILLYWSEAMFVSAAACSLALFLTRPARVLNNK